MTKSPESNANPPGVFLLGVGAQKAGTSWLHQQRHSRPDADFGVLKEYHVHDARMVPELARFRRLDAAIRRLGSWIQPRSWLRQWFIHKSQRYVDYFSWLPHAPACAAVRCGSPATSPPPMPCSAPPPWARSATPSRSKAFRCGPCFSFAIRSSA